ncbi:carbohydrate ABC transporter permease [Spirochaetia bacterium 38H-sp]|uniref:Carbohydrate ABC transporter permease n=1 Tax=Rarispira pelagica TaxID=3141764 RepID=A0ABU9U9F0_9SPIR
MSDIVIRQDRVWTERNIIKWGGFIFLALFSVMILTPFVWLFVTSLKDMGQYFSTDFKTIWFPHPLHWENYYKAFTYVPLLRYVFNSLWLGSLQTSLQLVSSSFVAYGFARFNFRGRNILFLILLCTMLLPTEVTMIPLFIFYKTIGWTNSYNPLIVPNLFGAAWSIFLIRQLMVGIPKEMDEAAFMDGAGTFRIWYSIVVPQVTPALFVAGLNSFLWSWKDFLGPLIYLNKKELYTLPLGIMFFESPTEVQYTVQLAAVVVALIPTLIIFAIGQKYFEQGINIGELK